MIKPLSAFRPAYVIGIGLHRYQRATDTPYPVLGLAAVRQALRDAMFATQMALGWCFPNAVMQYAVPHLERLSIDVAALARRHQRAPRRPARQTRRTGRPAACSRTVAGLHQVARRGGGAEAPPVRPAQAHHQAMARHLPGVQGRHLPGAADVPGARRHRVRAHHEGDHGRLPRRAAHQGAARSLQPHGLDNPRAVHHIEARPLGDQRPAAQKPRQLGHARQRLGGGILPGRRVASQGRRAAAARAARGGQGGRARARVHRALAAGAQDAGGGAASPRG